MEFPAESPQHGRNGRCAAAAFTVSHRINAERLVLLGWSRAILLQFAHPLIAAGIAGHSGFRDKLLAAVQRLRHTVRAMLALTFGDDADRERALERIHAIHRLGRHFLLRRGPEPRAVGSCHARRIRADVLQDAHSAAHTGRARHVLRGSRISRPGTGEVPCSWAALQTYLDRMHASGEITVSGQARELAAAVLSPAFGPLGAPGTAMNRLLTLGTLLPGVRAEYGFEWTWRDDRAFELVVRGLRRLRRPLPDRLAKWKAASRLEQRAFSDAKSLL